MKRGKTLINTHPELCKEWHPSKNGPLTYHDVTSGNRHKVWWKCPEGDDHEWEAAIYSRVNGAGCPCCSGRKVVPSNSLLFVNPELAKEWHPNKNGELGPEDVHFGSYTKVWWKCPKGDDHEWEAKVSTRKNGVNCPICRGLKVVLSNCLATTHPNLVKEWHPTKNKEVTPYNVTQGSAKKVWWKCSEGDDHEWLAPISRRTRNNGSGCSVCRGLTVVNSNSLATTHPKLIKEWHPIKNKKITPYDVTQGSAKKVWWKCSEGVDHEWLAPVKERVKGHGCSVCRGLTVVDSNCLATTHPNLVKEWHPTKNKEVTPYNVTQGSAKKVWWKCSEGDDHEWLALVSDRSNNHGCPICSGVKIVKSNSLATLRPDLAKEWHPSKNKHLTPLDVGVGTDRMVWWKCPKGDDHEWKTKLLNRTYGSGCPYCTLTPQSKQELTITFELLQFFDINPKGFKTRVNGKIWSIDIYIPKLNLGIEFDGNYWHKNKNALDKLKTKKLEDDGFKIMRIREEPLLTITPIDIVSALPFNPKIVTNDILKSIIRIYDIDENKRKAIDAYLKKNTIQNEESLNIYIDKILMEKSRNKK